MITARSKGFQLLDNNIEVLRIGIESLLNKTKGPEWKKNFIRRKGKYYRDFGETRSIDYNIIPALVADYSNSFNWYVGYSSDSYSGARFYTDLQMEEGTYPTWYIDGATRTNTTTLRNYAKSNYIDISGVDFDSTNKPNFSSGIINSGIFSGRNPSTNPFTVEAVVKSHITSGNRIWVDAQGNGTNQRFYSALIDSSKASIGIQGSALSDATPSHTNWTHQVIVMDGSNAKAYADGVYKFQKSYTSYTLPNSIVFGGRSGYYWDGEIAVARIYDRALNESEILRNFNAYRKRFSI